MAYLYGVEVALEHRRVGVARSMVGQLLAVFRRTGIESVWTGSSPTAPPANSGEQPARRGTANSMSSSLLTAVTSDRQMEPTRSDGPAVHQLGLDSSPWDS